jgi:hypothetical protein
MRNLTAILCVTLAVLLGSAGMSWSADFQKGVDAYNRGDYATALREWKPLAEQGNAPAQTNLGVMYAKGRGVPQNFETAMKLHTLAAEQGNVLAQFNLGLMYEDGHGVPKNYKTAVRWYRLGAEQGYARAQSNLGAMYADGQGVLQDYVRAHMWFDIAASSGHENIMENVTVRRMGGVFIGFNKNAVTNRDIVAKRMTPADISAAQTLARECVRKKYKGC